MSLVRRLLNFYVFSNIHVALAVASLTYITMYYFGSDDLTLPLFTFFATVVSYNFIRLYRRPELDSWFYQWVTQHKKLLWLMVVFCFLGMLFLLFKLKSTVLIMLLPLALLTFFYSVPVSGLSNLRSLPGFKLFLISVVWAVVTVLLPAVHYEISLGSDLFIVFVQRMLFIAAITLPFDLRDLNYDSSALKTIPQVYGEEKTKKIGLLLLMLFLGLNFLKNDFKSVISIEFIITLITLVLLLRATANQNKYYSALWVEALPICWLLLVLLGLH